MLTGFLPLQMVSLMPFKNGQLIDSNLILTDSVSYLKFTYLIYAIC